MPHEPAPEEARPTREGPSLSPRGSRWIEAENCSGLGEPSLCFLKFCPWPLASSASTVQAAAVAASALPSVATHRTDRDGLGGRACLAEGASSKVAGDPDAAGSSMDEASASAASMAAGAGCDAAAIPEERARAREEDHGC
mmetsp:Transcript_5122/g.14432  ORF Transcript_5122/g.14432 Transcript_5122/m.14432 type:complete len:141 (+) Transcript_5122:1674-2096(+)